MEKRKSNIWHAESKEILPFENLINLLASDKEHV